MANGSLHGMRVCHAPMSLPNYNSFPKEEQRPGRVQFGLHSLASEIRDLSQLERGMCGEFLPPES